MGVPLVITIVVFITTAVIFYFVGRSDSGHECEPGISQEVFEASMKKEYQRGLNNNRFDAEKSTAEKINLTNQINNLKKNLDVALTERDQFADQIKDLEDITAHYEKAVSCFRDQISDLEEKQESLNSKIVVQRDENDKLHNMNVELQELVNEMKENHGHDLVDHGNKVREETDAEWSQKISGLLNPKPKTNVTQEKPQIKMQGSFEAPRNVSSDPKQSSGSYWSDWSK